ncbi:MAG: hypothetical protein A2599_03740 [Candidatus Staskawiczbacteria bacterium RIFOXYD1_FULL_39_28]|uniref:NodB homology domain-containing protein n=1 Tax=Candidatus Staskawiczbacteria bacterium RIFOXYC1_FULL_38_18 TaxID=1802229 RepID=A0A1G2JC74_9BACT|nr:MAG: hypothetical protein A2401_01620 [Candidatus Staskawiczbacteria bacterium RIFOXYC1_FULL_38_18]OGZ91548.1 MAG: hypothetical protein A2599_03740 [Candidatus Staskawiczbacteria bacterium RIFOXYD1_FULL_39_28]
MKRFKKILIIVSLATFFSAIAPILVLGAGPNLIQNPTLQGTSGIPAGWLNASWGNASNAVFSFPSTTSPKIGTGNSAKITINDYRTNPGGGAAEWYFNPVTINPADLTFNFSNEYLSNAPTSLVAQYVVPANTTSCEVSIEGSSSFCYFTLQDLLPTNGIWATASATFTAPSYATAVSVLHVIYSNGTLSVGNYSLTQNNIINPSQGMVSLTFDDGWNSQYTNAFPILEEANMPATFYVITNPMIQSELGEANNILCNDPEIPYCDGAVISSTSSSWLALTQYPDPAERTYVFSQTYTASSVATLTITYFNAKGRAINGQSNIVLATLPATATPKTVSVTFQIPTGLNLNKISFAFKESVSGNNTLSVQNPSLVIPGSTQDTYMNVQQVKTLQLAGHEIGLHTANHCDMVMLEQNPDLATEAGGPPFGACASALSAPTTPEQEIQEAMQDFLENGIFSVNTMAYPYGSFNANIESLVENNNMIAGRTVLAGYNTKNTDPYALFNQIVDQNVTSNGIQAVKNWIDTAMANKQWLILTFHNIESASILTANGDIDGTTPAFLQKIVDYLKTKNVPVVTVRQAMESF